MQSRPSRSRKHEGMGLNTVPAQQHRFSEIPGAFVFCQLRHEPRLPLLVQPHQRQAWAGAGSFDVTTPNRPSSVSPPPRLSTAGIAGVWPLPITPWFLVVRAAYTRAPAGPLISAVSLLQLHAALPRTPRTSRGILARILAAPIRCGAHVRRYPPVAVRRSIRRPDPSGEGQRLLIIRCEDGRSVRRGVAQDVCRETTLVPRARARASGWPGSKAARGHCGRMATQSLVWTTAEVR